MQELFFKIFPKPRRPVTMQRAIPLIAFIALFVSVWLIVTLSSITSFENPEMLWLIVVSGWFWWMYAAGHAGLASGRGVVALFIRLCLVGAFVFLLAEPRAVRTSKKLAVVYAIDMSDSVGDDIANQALSFVARTATEKPTEDYVGLVVFGRNAAVELPPREVFPIENVSVNARIDRDATNIEQGLNLAATLLPEEHIGRIVLISDGVRTEGQLQRVIDDLKGQGIAVDVLPIEYGHENEVWLERLDLPKNIKSGETYKANILLSALKAGKGKLRVMENGQLIAEPEVEFKAGKNRFEVPLYLRTSGYYEYSAEIILPEKEDGWKENNVAMNYMLLEGQGKVLLVTDPGGKPEDYERLVKAMREGERSVEVKTAYEFPRDSLSLMPYDCVVFVNTPADTLDVVQMKAMHDAVYDLGIGFLMVGGENSFGPGGYHRTKIEDALPVTMDIKQRKIMPKGALAIILHTCEFPQGNAWAKRITKQAIKVLGKNDEAGVLIYGSIDGQFKDGWLFPLTPVSEYESKMVRKINMSEPADMPSFVPTMEAGLLGLSKSDAASKHMLIISDGDPTAPVPALLQKYVANNITISTIGINPHRPQDTQTLQLIAQTTGGRYYFANNPNQLPSIFIKEAKTLRRSMVQNREFVPELGFYSDIMKGIDQMPSLKGFVLSSAKERSNVVLQTPPAEGEKEPDPLLVTWRYGLGKTAAYTSDLSPMWAQNWMGWSQYQSFVQQLLISISRVNKQKNLQMRTEVVGGVGMITVEDFHSDDTFLDLAAVVSGPRDKSETIKLKQVAPRRYQAEVPLWGKGRYQVSAQALGSGRDERVHGGMILPYSPEYLRFRSNPRVLMEISDQTDGRFILNPDKYDGKTLFGVDRKAKQSSLPIFDWFIWALAILIPLDVAVRRVQLDWYVVKEMLFGKENKESSETMGALLKRKAEVGNQLKSKQTDESESTIKKVMSQVQKEKPKGGQVSGGQSKKIYERPKPNLKTEDMSTTQRLLAEKKKRKQEED